MGTRVTVPPHFVGPPGMGHGGYVAGLVARPLGGGRDGAVQVTLRRPTPVGVELILDEGDGRAHLLQDVGGDEPALIAEAERHPFSLDVPAVPSSAEARAAEAGSPSHWDVPDREGVGVHPICLGCGLARADHDGMGIAVGALEVDGTELVAATWRPRSDHALADDPGVVDPLWALAALDCPGAMAYLARDVGVGLLGRIAFEQHRPATVGDDHVVMGWQIDRDGRKHHAGTALCAADGTALATSRAVWFSHT